MGWQNQIFISVFIEGPEGGLFLYSPTVGTGNLVASIAPQGGVDPFGNTYVGPGFAVYGGPGKPYAFMSSDFEGETGMFFPSNDPNETFASAINLQFNNTGTPQQKVITNVQGPITNTRQDFVVIGLTASADDGSEFAAAFHEYHDEHGNTYEEIILGNGGTQIPYAAQIIGNTPGLTEPQSDTWHTLAPLASGFNVTGNNFNGDPCYAEYTFDPIGNFGGSHIRVNANVTAGPGLSTFKLLTGSPLGIDYRPTQPRYFPVTFNFAAINGTNNPNMGIGILETSGHIFVFGGAGSAIDTNLVIDHTVRLD